MMILMFLINLSFASTLPKITPPKGFEVEYERVTKPDSSSSEFDDLISLAKNEKEDLEELLRNVEKLNKKKKLKKLTLGVKSIIEMYGHKTSSLLMRTILFRTHRMVLSLPTNKEFLNLKLNLMTNGINLSLEYFNEDQKDQIPPHAKMGFDFYKSFLAFVNRTNNLSLKYQMRRLLFDLLRWDLYLDEKNKDYKSIIYKITQYLKSTPVLPKAIQSLNEELYVQESLEKTLNSYEGVLYVGLGIVVSPIESQIKEMNFVLLPGGSFQMGCTSNSSDCNEDEKPVHRVTLSPFEMMTTEVTQGMWKSVMGDNPSDFDSCGENCPVEHISWNEVQGFITKLNEKNDGYLYRLPTEAEWEYASRAGTSTDYYGDGAVNLENIAWYNGNSYSSTHPVAQKYPNGFGLYDMHGNVWELVSDWYEKDYYSNSVKENPWGPSGGSSRVIRGGSWNFSPSYLRSSNRLYLESGFLGSDFVGFRLVRTHK